MKTRFCLLLSAALALNGCSQLSTPAVESSTAARQNAPVQDVGNTQGAAPMNNQADPSDTTGSVGGSPGGTSSVQTAPSSSNGVR